MKSNRRNFFIQSGLLGSSVLGLNVNADTHNHQKPVQITYLRNQFDPTKDPKRVRKSFYDLTDEDDQVDGMNIEALLHGPDSVPGPAYIDPGNLASSTSMAGDVDYFTYEETYQKNKDEGNGWKNRIPRR